MKNKLSLTLLIAPAALSLIALKIVPQRTELVLALSVAIFVAVALMMGLRVGFQMGHENRSRIRDGLIWAGAAFVVNSTILFLGCATEGGPTWDRRVNASSRKEMAKVAAALPSRDPNLPRDALDISSYFNATLDEQFYVKVGPQNLKALPSGWQTFCQIPFDVRGAIRLSSRPRSDAGKKFPVSVRNIQVNRACRRLHFLHGNGWEVEKAIQVSKYVLRYSDGQRAEIPIENGRDLLATWVEGDRTEEERSLERLGGRVAWKTSFKQTERHSQPRQITTRVFLTSWKNPRPQIKIDSIDFESKSAIFVTPFLLALTIEPND
jgi:hypothetical protein